MFTGDSSVCSLEKSVDREKTLDRLKRKRKTSPVSYGLWLLNFFSPHPTATAICCLTLKDFLTLHNDFLKIWFFGNSSKTLIFAHEMIIFLGIAFCSLCSDKWQLWCGFRFPLKLVQFTLTVFYNSNIPGSISSKPLKNTWRNTISDKWFKHLFTCIYLVEMVICMVFRNVWQNHGHLT